MRNRQVVRRIAARQVSDGAGVKLWRSLGNSSFTRIDPLLMLDEFGSDEAADYLAGFPAHPHRGFETVTYMLEGHFQHEDHLGHVGELRSGGVQWMCAGRGIIHSEMPLQEAGRLHGFQLWVNLPARDKLQPAAYRNIDAAEMPVFTRPGVHIKVLAGQLALDGQTLNGPIPQSATALHYFDVALEAGASIRLPVPEAHQVVVYPFEGRLISVGETLVSHELAVLDDGDTVQLAAESGPGRCLLLSGQPLREPIAQYGPFVMNTQQEIETALADYREGRLTATE